MPNHSFNSQELCDFIEDLLKETSQKVLDGCDEDLELYHKYLAKPKRSQHLKTLLREKFAQMSYDEAIGILKRKKIFEGVKWGDDLTKEMEKYLVAKIGNKPLFVHDFPSSLKPFYARGKVKRHSSQRKTRPTSYSRVRLLRPLDQKT